MTLTVCKHCGTPRHTWPASKRIRSLQRKRGCRVKVQVGGKEYPSIAAAARAMGIAPETVHDRISTLGWSLERALTTPARPYGRRTAEPVDARWVEIGVILEAWRVRYYGEIATAEWDERRALTGGHGGNGLGGHPTSGTGSRGRVEVEGEAAE